jgi:hypothetical protein
MKLVARADDKQVLSVVVTTDNRAYKKTGLSHKLRQTGSSGSSIYDLPYLLSQLNRDIATDGLAAVFSRNNSTALRRA